LSVTAQGATVRSVALPATGLKWQSQPGPKT
jgi:hypothetical protein